MENESDKSSDIEAPTSDGNPSDAPPPDTSPTFDELSNRSDPGLVREFIWFLRYNKKWWMTPIIAILLLLVGLAFLTTSPAAPFIYTLF